MPSQQLERPSRASRAVTHDASPQRSSQKHSPVPGAYPRSTQNQVASSSEVFHGQSSTPESSAGMIYTTSPASAPPSTRRKPSLASPSPPTPLVPNTLLPSATNADRQVPAPLLLVNNPSSSTSLSPPGQSRHGSSTSMNNTTGSTTATSQYPSSASRPNTGQSSKSSVVPDSPGARAMIKRLLANPALPSTSSPGFASGSESEGMYSQSYYAARQSRQGGYAGGAGGGGRVLASGSKSEPEDAFRSRSRMLPKSSPTTPSFEMNFPPGELDALRMAMTGQWDPQSTEALSLGGSSGDKDKGRKRNVLRRKSSARTAASTTAVPLSTSAPQTKPVVSSSRGVLSRSASASATPLSIGRRKEPMNSSSRVEPILESLYVPASGHSSRGSSPRPGLATPRQPEKPSIGAPTEDKPSGGLMTPARALIEAYKRREKEAEGRRLLIEREKEKERERKMAASQPPLTPRSRSLPRGRERRNSNNSGPSWCMGKDGSSRGHGDEEEKSPSPYYTVFGSESSTQLAEESWSRYTKEQFSSPNTPGAQSQWTHISTGETQAGKKSLGRKLSRKISGKFRRGDEEKEKDEDAGREEAGKLRKSADMKREKSKSRPPRLSLGDSARNDVDLGEPGLDTGKYPPESPSHRGGGTLWRLVKKISVGGLREKAQPVQDDVPPPVPALPRHFQKEASAPPSPPPTSSPVSAGLKQASKSRPSTTASSSSDLSSVKFQRNLSLSSSSSFQDDVPPVPPKNLGYQATQDLEHSRKSSDASTQPSMDRWTMARTPSAELLSLPVPPRKSKPAKRESKTESVEEPSRRRGHSLAAAANTKEAPLPASNNSSPVASILSANPTTTAPPPRPMRSSQRPPPPGPSVSASVDGHGTRRNEVPFPTGRKSESSVPTDSTNNRNSSHSTTSTVRLGRHMHKRSNSFDGGTLTASVLSLSTHRSGSPSSTMMKFRELNPDLGRHVLTEQEKAAKWDDLLRKSDKAGGTLHIGGFSGRLASDRLKF